MRLKKTQMTKIKRIYTDFFYQLFIKQTCHPVKVSLTELLVSFAKNLAYLRLKEETQMTQNKKIFKKI